MQLLWKMVARYVAVGCCGEERESELFHIERGAVKPGERERELVPRKMKDFCVISSVLLAFFAKILL